MIEMTDVMEVATENCPECGEFTYVTVPVEGYNLWKSGMHIQTAMPLLSTNERELLLTGTHPECWDAMFPPEDEEDDFPDTWFGDQDYDGYYPEEEYFDFDREYDDIY